MDCLKPPLSEPPPGEWYCRLCVWNRTKRKKQRQFSSSFFFLKFIVILMFFFYPVLLFGLSDRFQWITFRFFLRKCSNIRSTFFHFPFFCWFQRHFSPRKFLKFLRFLKSPKIFFQIFPRRSTWSFEIRISFSQVWKRFPFLLAFVERKQKKISFFFLSFSRSSTDSPESCIYSQLINVA